MKKNNCFEIDGQIFAIQEGNQSNIPDSIASVKTLLPYGLYTRWGKVAFNHLTGTVLGWRWDGEDEKWDTWYTSHSAELRFEGPEDRGRVCWIVTKKSDHDRCIVAWYKYVGSSWIQLSTDSVNWKELANLRIDVLESTNVEILTAQRTWSNY